MKEKMLRKENNNKSMTVSNLGGKKSGGNSKPINLLHLAIKFC